MADPELNINLKLTFQNFTAGLDKASEGLKDFGVKARQLGRDLQAVSREMTLFGGAITAGFGVAFANAKKDLPEVGDQLKSLSNSFQALSDSVATAALPTLKEFSNFVNNLAISIQTFAANNQALVNNILKFGALSLAIGTAGIAIAQMLKALKGLTGLLIDFIAIITNVNVVVTALVIGVLLLADALDGIKGIVSTASAGLVGFGNAAAQALGRAFGFQTASPKSASVIDTFTQLLAKAQKALDDMLTKNQAAAQRMTDVWGKFTEGFKSGLKDLGDAVSELGAKIEQSLEKSLGDTFFNALTGRIKGLKEVMISFGEDVLKAFTGLLANRAIAGLFGTASGSNGLLGNFGINLGGILGGGNRGGGAGAGTSITGTTKQFDALTDNMKKFGRVKDELMENFKKLGRTTEDLTRSFRNNGQAQGGGNSSAAVTATVGADAKNGVTQLNDGLGQTLGLVGGIQGGFTNITKLIVGIGKTFAVVQLAMLAVSIAAGAASFAFLSQLANAVASAWLPAAILASIATLGAAAAIGLVAVTGALAGGKSVLGSFTSSAGNITAGAGGAQDGVKIPAMADGGIVTRPTLAMIGEAGAEAVIPLSKGKNGGAGGLGGGGVNIDIRIDTAMLNNPSNMQDFVKMLREELGRALS